MTGLRKCARGFAKIDVAIFIIIVAIIGVIALPRYNRFVKTAEARTYIHQMTAATQAALEECRKKHTDSANPGKLPPDAVLIECLKKHLGGSVPENPFTKSNSITLKHHRSLAPCNSLETTGGWVWNLVPSGASNQTLISKVWLNSDTVNISKGMGESCIQP